MEEIRPTHACRPDFQSDFGFLYFWFDGFQSGDWVIAGPGLDIRQIGRRKNTGNSVLFFFFLLFFFKKKNKRTKILVIWI